MNRQLKNRSKHRPKRAKTVFLVRDDALTAKNGRATEAVQSLVPGAKVELLRTESGEIHWTIRSMPAGDKRLLDQVYRAIMDAIDEGRGRRPGVKKVQTKLNLPVPVAKRLKSLAKEKGETMSEVVAELVGR